MMNARARAARSGESVTSASQPSAIVAIIGGIETAAHHLAARIARLVPAEWQCRQFSNIDKALDHEAPATAMVVLTCAEPNQFDTAALTDLVDRADGAPLVIVGRGDRLPSRAACVRAGVAQRINTEADAELVDPLLNQAITLARQHRRLNELELLNEAQRARPDARIAAAPEAFLDNPSLDDHSIESAATGPAVVRTPADDNARSPWRGLVLDRPDSRELQPSSESRRADTSDRLWLSPAQIDSSSPLIREASPIVDARMAFHRHLARMRLQPEANGRHGLIFIAVDDVAAMQAQFGLANADELFEEVGLHLIDNLGATDRCFRFAVGEYVLSLQRVAFAAVSEAAQLLIRSIGETEFSTRDRTVHITASGSAIMLGRNSAVSDRYFKQLVDTAYRVRDDGGDGYRECEGEPVADVPSDTAAWQARLERALSDDRFRLALQTLTSLAGDDSRYYDVLLRYLDDDDELVMPNNFLPAAETAGLMPDIDLWVARRAARMVAEQAEKNVDIALFVKVSAATLDNPDAFTDALVANKVMSAINRQQLIFCVRERDARSHVAATRRLAKRLDQAGFRFALTHFGEANSHVAMLDHMVLSFIKLAPDFTDQLADPNAEDKRLQHMTEYAHEHGVPLVAEHIEDAASMARLWQAGVNYVQGNFIQEPDPDAI